MQTVSPTGEHAPEYLRLLVARYPDFRNDAAIIANIGMKIHRIKNILASRFLEEKRYV